MNNYLVIAAIIAVAVIFFASGRSQASAPAPAVTSLGDFTLGPATSVVIRIPITGRRPGDSKLKLSGTIFSDDFFAKSNGSIFEGHCGIMLRADLDALDKPDTPYRGHGLIFGSLWTGSTPPNGMASMVSCAAIETWAKGAPDEPAQWVKPQSVSAPLADGVGIPFEITSAPSAGGWDIAASISGVQGAVIADDNKHINAASEALALFAYNPGGGVMHFNGVTAVWS
jgi:hypothetical protein